MECIQNTFIRNSNLNILFEYSKVNFKKKKVLSIQILFIFKVFKVLIEIVLVLNILTTYN